MDKRKVILDVDTGADDAVAIMLALLAPELEVIGICSVNGNREVRLTTDNTLRVKALMGSDVPVYRGCEYPMVATLTPGRKPGTVSYTHLDVYKRQQRGGAGGGRGGPLLCGPVRSGRHPRQGEGRPQTHRLCRRGGCLLYTSRCV